MRLAHDLTGNDLTGVIDLTGLRSGLRTMRLVPRVGALVT